MAGRALCEFSTLLWKCHVHVGHIGPITVNYPARRNWPPYFIHRNSAMTALSPWRNKHGVLTHHVSLCSHFFTFSSDTSALFNIQISAAQRCALTGVGVFRVNAVQEVTVNWGQTELSVLSLHVGCFDFGQLDISHRLPAYFPSGGGKEF